VRPRDVIVCLITETQLLNELAVRLDVSTPQVIQEPFALAYHLQEAATTVMILAVLTKMVREVIDALGQNCDLNSRRPGVAFVRPVLRDRWCFVKSHCLNRFARFSDLLEP
jgi:hypothetical protein